LPETVEDFVAMRDHVATTPQGGAAMMVVALLIYADHEDVGLQCLTVAVDRDRLTSGPKGYKGWQLRNADLQRLKRQLVGKGYLPRSYVKGAVPGNGYQLSSPPYSIECSDNPHSGNVDSGTYKVFVATSGASNPRPITVKQNDKGIWKASEWSSLIVGIVAPANGSRDDL
jgi:hypothetical protein